MILKSFCYYSASFEQKDASVSPSGEGTRAEPAGIWEEAETEQRHRGSSDDGVTTINIIKLSELF